MNRCTEVLEGYVLQVTSASINFSESLLHIFQSWKLHSCITQQISPLGNPIYRIWIKEKESLIQLAEKIYEVELGKYVNYKRINMSQHSKIIMIIIENLLIKQGYQFVTNGYWVLVEGKIQRTSNNEKVKFRTNISKSILDQLKMMSAENNVHMNLLIENGLQNLLNEKHIVFDKKLRKGSGTLQEGRGYKTEENYYLIKKGYQL